MYCPNCGKEIPSDSVFCEECGCRIDAPAEGRAPAPAPGAQKSAKSGSGAGKYVLICLLAMVVIVAGVFVTIKALKTEKPADTSTETEPVADAKEQQQMPAEPDVEPAKEEPELDTPADTGEAAPPEPEADTDSESEADTDSEPDAAAQRDEDTKPLPYEDSLEAPKDTDFAWIPDVVTGDLTGDFLGNDQLIGRWKGEIIYDKGIWELVYVTIDENAGVKIEPYKINHGDGWDDESDRGYNLDGDFDVSGVNAAGDYGSISLYTFLESLGTQYGVGTFTVNNTDTAKVYLVRP